MKNLHLLFTTLILLFALSLHAQQVDREYVVVEIATGTWCQYCPGSAMGADDLIANGHDVAIIEYHYGDDYQNTYATSRISYYGVSGYPTAYFDGVLSVVGGSQTQSMYPQYLPRYNQRIGIQSSFSIEVEGETYGLIDYEVDITVDKVASTSASNLKLHLVITESGIEESWQGMDELNYVERLMVPNQYGTSVDFTNGNTQEVNLSFSVDESWVYENCEVVIFLQDHATKEIHQATKMPLSAFDPAYERDASIISTRNVPETSCSGSVSPIATIRNNGSGTLTSLDIVYQVNGGETQTESWTGELEFLETEEVELSAIGFEVEEDNTLELCTSNPNGQGDQFPDNDTTWVEFEEAEHTETTVGLILRLDSSPEDISWEVTNDEGEVVYEGGDYTQPNQNISEVFDFTDDPGCYKFSIYDAAGDGLSLPGFYLLYYGNNITIKQGGHFGYQESLEFVADDFVSIPESVGYNNNVRVYPNPFAYTTNISFSLTQREDVTIEIYNLLGQKVFSTGKISYGIGEHNKVINPDNLDKGVYFVQLVIGENTYTKKVAVND
ncbi:MAG: T9SS type A sorting domain-containing protein [Bacteroidales bacterium]|nr:T9SS type A sorting domain-containing protein [Bacteroidales bacterium]MCF8387683.1 T9SS type A sorting domain-containing protein [Bacteroidales bacterium]MCF8398766.1 T9SS type A sorting domain-containing protein [Bacteroidales bacterium]